MIKSKILMLLMVVFLGSITAGYCANVTGAASIPNNSPELNLVIKELTQPNQDPGTSGTVVTTMNFGQLTHSLADGRTRAYGTAQNTTVCLFTPPVTAISMK